MKKTMIIQGLRNWLGKEGIDHFRQIKEKHGRIDACWMDRTTPHLVHFREGMAVRNKMRELTNYSWSDHDYDDLWVEFIEEAIK
jgi:hypothetical protein